VLGSVVFRYRPSPDDPARSDRVNEAVRLRLLATGQAVVGRTEVAGRTHLKLTLMNPPPPRPTWPRWSPWSPGPAPPSTGPASPEGAVAGG
jgi:hypothetical protein